LKILFSCGEKKTVQFAVQQPESCDLTSVVDAICDGQLPRRIGDPGVEINWLSALP
jgi:hypothetical protein